jgi:hypothetical protein
MAVALYMDAHIPRAITLGLRMRTVDVLTAQEDGAGTLPDPALLERATQLGRVLFTFDDDLLLEAVKRQAETKPFSGVIYAHPLRISIGECIRELELMAKAGEPKDLQDRVEFLPL